MCLLTTQNVPKKQKELAKKQPHLKPFQIVTTVHKDVSERLEDLNPALAKKVRKVLDVNKAERHIRGGLATKEKYLHL
ncbi:MAG: hypothetical protein E7264_03685 [Lachnospiraceae bacterium]|nr:hypothetical protein [Lachnospiraceae bacterium]